jgi:glutamate formiminotransferase/formiminotetrahydrofolate cyclodeaminase
LESQNRSAGIPYRDILETAVQSLGLSDVADFNIDERVLGLPKFDKDALVEMTVADFTHEVSRESPAPGGGSIAALAGALGASLFSMVSNLTASKPRSEKIDQVLFEIAEKAQNLKDELIKAVDDDTNAFNQYMEARRLPKKTEEEKAARNRAMLDGLKEAVKVPLNTARLSLEALKLAKTVASVGNPNSITDVGVGAHIARTGVIGGIYNVLINLKDIEDAEFNSAMKNECELLRAEADSLIEEIEKEIMSKIS